MIEDTTEEAVLPKRWFILKTNGVANIRSINASIKEFDETPKFWMAGFMVPRKYRKTTILRKEFLFYDYAFIELGNAMKFERFLSDRKIPAYLLYVPGTKVPVSLTESEISRVRQTEAIKQQEVEKFASPKLRVGSLIEVVNGPFIGCKGTILGLTKTHAVLEMNVFGRPTRVNIGIDFLENLLQDFGPEPTSLLEDEE